MSVGPISGPLKKKTIKGREEFLRDPIMGLLVIFRRKHDFIGESTRPADSDAEFGACNQDGYLEMGNKSEDRD